MKETMKKFDKELAIAFAVAAGANLLLVLALVFLG